MINNTQDPFDGLLLDEEEQSLETALENSEFQENPDLDDTKAMLEAAAIRHRHLNNSKPITLRINQLDLIKIKAKAKRNNIPYQTLLSVMVHDFAEDKTELKIR